ncbi:MAG: hypothetical protein ACHRHE_20220 [Tepidisphaerales bacterium]
MPYWSARLGEFAALSLPEFLVRRGCGPHKAKHIMQIMADVRQAVASLPPDSPLAVRLLPRELAPAEAFFHDVATNSAIATRDRIAREVLEPLLRQVTVDASAWLAEQARVRIETGATLESLGAACGITREGIRQKLRLVSRILTVRWPAGRLLLREFLAQARRNGATSDAEWLSRMLDVLYHDKLSRSADDDSPPQTPATGDSQTGQVEVKTTESPR